jgi:hypothetical protein
LSANMNSALGLCSRTLVSTTKLLVWPFEDIVGSSVVGGQLSVVMATRKLYALHRN